MVLGSTQPLTEMSTGNISWGKCGRCVVLTTLPPSCADCLEIWEPEPAGTLRAVQSSSGIALSFLLYLSLSNLRSWKYPISSALQNPFTSPHFTSLTTLQTLFFEILDLFRTSKPLHFTSLDFTSLITLQPLSLEVLDLLRTS